MLSQRQSATGWFFWIILLFSLSHTDASVVFGQAVRLIGQWHFEEGRQATVPDASGNNFDATLHLFAEGSSTSAQPLSLDGYYEHGVVPKLQEHAFQQGATITAWVRPTRLRRANMIVGYPNSNSSWTTPTLGLFAPEADRVGFGIWTHPKTILASPEATRMQQWTFVAGTYDNQVARLYIDGECVAEEKRNSKIPVSDDPLMIGTGTMSNRFFRGQFGEVRLYNGALHASQVAAIFAEGINTYPRTPPKNVDRQEDLVVRSKRQPDSPWRDYPTRTLGGLTGYQAQPVPPKLSRFGGWLAKQTDATGFFRAENIDGRWWLIDPLGYYFVHIGVCAVTPGSSANMKRNFKERFGTRTRWAEATSRLLRDNYFNGTGGWTANDDFRATDAPFPYIVRMSFMSSFGKQLGVTHRVPGHTGFELQCIPVFHPDFPAFCEEHAQQLDRYREDPFVLGVYSDNELQTPKLDNYLQLDRENPVQRPNYEAALDWLRERKSKDDVTAADVTVLDRMEFAGYAFKRYFSIVAKAIKAHAPNHMYIGARFMRPNFVNPFAWKAASPYCDVVTVNYYGTWGPDLEEVAHWQKLCPRPIMITEFYVKGDDSGLPNRTGAGWIVPTQADRGHFYQHYVLALLESKCCVGWHWFKYIDNDPAHANAESSNIDSNKGIVDIRYQPYEAFLEKMQAVNREVYPLTEFFDE